MITPFFPFRGLDLREGAVDRPGYLAEALNVVLLNGGAVRRRPALTRRATLPADSVGLYAIGDSLRTCAPYNAGDETSDDILVPTISVDYLTPGAAALTSVLGQVADASERALLLVQDALGTTELHHAPIMGTPPGGTTLVSPGFTPNFALKRARGRAFTLDANLRYLRYSEVDGIDAAKLDNWVPSTAVDGAGFESLSQHVAGAGRGQALALFGGRLAVLYRGAILIYIVDEDQGRFALDQVLTGPGTTAPRSVVEVGSDLLFLSDAGVRSLGVVGVTQGAGEDATATGLIDPLVVSLASNLTLTPIGHYSRRLGAYLLAFGQDVLCLSLLPGQAPIGWTRWRLPVEVDGFADAGGTTWMRSGTALYSLDDAQVQDEVTVGDLRRIPVRVETVPLSSTMLVACRSVAARGVEPVQVQAIVDGRPGLAIDGTPLGQPVVLPPRSPEPARAMIGRFGRTFAFRCYDNDAQPGWRLDGAWLDVG